MTIAAGFLCTDGILICADTEVVGGLGKYQASKVRFGKQEGVCEYLVSGAGNTGYIGMAYDLVGQAMYDGQADLLAAKDHQDRFNIFYGKMRDVARILFEQIRDVYPYQTDKPTLDLIVGIRFLVDDSPPPKLLHIGQDASVEWSDEIVCGTGDIIVRSHLSILHTTIMPMDQMRQLAIFAVYQAKKFGFGVGGATQIYTLPRRGWTTMWDERELAALTERAMHLCMVEARDPKIKPELIRAWADKLRDDIIKLKITVDGQEQGFSKEREQEIIDTMKRYEKRSDQ